MPPVTTPVPPLDEHRTTRISPLISPAFLRHELPVSAGVADTVVRARADVVDILDGRDDRLLVVVGRARSTTRPPRSTTRTGWPSTPSGWPASCGSSCAPTSRSRARRWAGRA
jgi:hypothetical protein